LVTRRLTGVWGGVLSVQMRSVIRIAGAQCVERIPEVRHYCDGIVCEGEADAYWSDISVNYDVPIYYVHDVIEMLVRRQRPRQVYGAP
jgi:hypothetical protein